MGTFYQWAHGIWYGLFFGLFMSIYNVGQTPSINLRKTVFTTVSSSILFWFAFGLWESFGSRAFHNPIVFLTMPSGICGLFILWISRPKRPDKPENNSQ
jgi:ABC-type transport system involved in multi-copper enzyme maturation permease subunit